jgi:hypothetical protein
MAFASITYTSVSGTTFALTNSNGDPIDYIRQSDIYVYVNNVLKAVTTDYTFNTAGTAIVLNTAVTNATVTLQRLTDIADRTVVYTAGSTLTSQDLNNADNQILYGLQEFKDYVAGGQGVTDGDKGDIIVGNNGASWSIDNGVITDSKFVAGTITNSSINASAAIAGSKIQTATTSNTGAVQLTDSVSSTSTSTAATPNSVKTAYDLASTANTTASTASTTASAALPKAGGAMTGDLTLNAQSDLRFADSDSSNSVGFQAPSTITSNVTWTLPATDASVSGYALKSDGAGNLSWGLAGGASGASGNQVFYENDIEVTASYTITSNKNAVTAGPVTVQSGVVVTIPSGSSWTIV